MFNVDVATLVCGLVDQFLPRKNRGALSHDDDGMAFSAVGIEVSTTLAFYDYSKFFKCDDNAPCETITVHGTAQIICAVYVHTFVHTSFDELPSPPIFGNDFSRFKNTSNHDSCWRSDGIQSPLANLYFEMADSVIQRAHDEAKYCGIAPRDDDNNRFAPIHLTQHNRFSYSDIVKFGTIRIASNADSHDSRFHIVRGTLNSNI